MDVLDLIIIGAGPAGYVGAIRAAQLGMKVAVVEKEYLGGTCLNVGCIPSKALLDATHEYTLARTHFASRGIKVGELTVDLAALMEFKNKTVRTLTGGVGSLLKKHGIQHVKGQAQVASAGTVLVASGGQTTTLTASRILIATGSEPMSLPSLPIDGVRIVTSTEALALPRVPQRLLVVGAGAIGLELGSVWSRLGSKVTIVEFLDHIAANADGELGGLLLKSMQKRGMEFRLSSKVESAQVQDDGVKVSIVSGDNHVEQVVDQVLVCVGRRPVTRGLNLEALGVSVDQRGFVRVDEHYQTNVAGVFAVGDCIGGAMLAHKASEEAGAAVELMAGKAGHVNYNAIPSIIYTDPELATVGLSEEECRKQGTAVKIGKFPFAANGRARCMDDTEGLVKIIADAKTDRVLGVGILHSRASDLIGEATLAMEYSASSEDIARTVHAHPTLSEAIKQAALGVDGRTTDL